jgi:recombination protein RecT
MMEKRPAIVETPETYLAMLKRLKPSLAQLKPNDQSVERFLQLCRRLTQRNPDLLLCTVESLENAIKDAAALGLDPTGLMGFGYIVPFKTKRGDHEAVFIPGYHGLLDLVYRTGKIAGIRGSLVHQSDDWTYIEGLNPVLEHTPRFRGTFEYDSRHECVGGYLVWWDVIGGRPVVQRHLWMWLEELERVRRLSKQTDRSGASKFGPWRDHWGPMAFKSMIRQAIKLMPLTPEVAADITYALSKEDERMGLADPVLDITPGDPETPDEGRRKIGAASDGEAESEEEPPQGSEV